jgi:hypothetical protein
MVAIDTHCLFAQELDGCHALLDAARVPVQDLVLHRRLWVGPVEDLLHVLSVPNASGHAKRN